MPPGRGAQYRSKMRAVGMLRTGFILVFLIIAYANTLPLQLLPSIPGYVPVYIRNGDEPLEDINLALAEAFAEHSSLKHLPNLKESHIALEVHQPVDYEQTPRAVEASEKSTLDVFEVDDPTGGKNDNLNVQTSLLKEATTPVKRRETDRSDVQKKSEAVTLEVNRSRIPQLLTAQEREDERTSEAEGETEKLKSIPVLKEIDTQVQNGQEKENDDSKKVANEPEKSDFKPNELADLNPNYPELPSEILQQHNGQDFGSANDGHQDPAGFSSISLEETSEELESEDSFSASGEGEGSSKEDKNSSADSKSIESD